RPLAVGPAHARVAVAGHPRLVVHEGVAAAREGVEQRRLADVGAPDEGDGRKHGARSIRNGTSVTRHVRRTAERRGRSRTRREGARPPGWTRGDRAPAGAGATAGLL